MNILRWLDNTITFLKISGISFENDVAHLTNEMLYTEIPKNVEPYDYQNKIGLCARKDTVLVYYMDDSRLFPRLHNVQEDIKKMKQFAAIGGFDLSPSILMLRLRQRFSILINSVYNCYLGMNGIKILPNGRCGDFSTISTLLMYPKNCNVLISYHGCKNHGFKHYGLYQTLYLIDVLAPKKIFVYGEMSKKEYKLLYRKYKEKILVYPDHRNKSQHKKNVYTIGTSINAQFNNMTDKKCYSYYILQKNEIEFNPLIDNKEVR